MELLEDNEGKFVINTHYGHREEKLRSRSDHADEFVERAITVFEQKVANKLKRDKDYRQANPGENIFSPALVAILADVRQEKKNAMKAETEMPPEHRKLLV
jgi:hypothetical protein